MRKFWVFVAIICAPVFGLALSWSFMKAAYEFLLWWSGSEFFSTMCVMVLGMAEIAAVIAFITVPENTDKLGIYIKRLMG